MGAAAWAILIFVRLPLIVLGLAVLVLQTVALRFDVTRESFEARARSVEVSAVPQLITGPAGRYYDSAFEMPLSLPAHSIPDYVKNVFITQEDQQFRSFWHVGINPVTLLKALTADVKGSSQSFGASTITMQLVKNVQLSQERTYYRKLFQLLLAVVVEGLFTKDEIFAMYVNTAYFGDNAYGIEAAARRFFGRSVGYSPKVNLLEAAMLAASVKSPSRLNPATDPKLLEERARTLIARMTDEGYDTATGQQRRDRGPRNWSMEAYWYRDVAMRYLVPPELRDRADPLMMSATIDTEAQLYADLAAINLVESNRSAGYDSSLVIVMEHDGAIAALAAGHEYDGVDIAKVGRVSPGSTLKPFMYLCALERGMRPETKVVDQKRDWPKNFSGRNYGEVTLDFAFMRSLNTIAVQLFEVFGPDCLADVLGRVGIALDDPGAPTAVLGSEYVSLLSLASAYATLANGGFRVEPYAIRYARTHSGISVYWRPPIERDTRITEARPYCDLLGMLRSVTRAGGTGAAAAFEHPVYGKTGTSQGYRDALFAGFTGRYVAVVWLGRQARGLPSRPVTGGEAPAEAFKWVMANLHEGKTPIPINCDIGIQIAGR